jgi:hypothetical protein
LLDQLVNEDEMAVNLNGLYGADIFFNVIGQERDRRLNTTFGF